MIGKSVYFGGFVLTVNSVAYTPGGDSPQVSIDVLYANKGRTPAPFGLGTSGFDLASGDHHYEVANSSPDMPIVPGQAQNVGKLVFDVDSAFSLDTAVLTVGDASMVQSVIPLGGTGALVDNAPQQLNVDSSASAGPLTVKITGGELRADLPLTFQQVDNGKRELLLNFDASNASSRPAPYGTLVTGFSNFSLKEPSGNSIVAYSNGDPYGAAPTVTVDPGQTKHAYVVFTVDAPTAGDYVLTVSYENGDGSTSTGTGTFTLP